MNWWADRLAERDGAVTRPPHVPFARNDPPSQYAPQSAPKKPQHSRREDASCPSCGGSNYMAAPGTSYRRCYDCGHPIVQSGSGVGSIRSDAPSKKATQVATEGYQPTRIVGRVE